MNTVLHTGLAALCRDKEKMCRTERSFVSLQPAGKTVGVIRFNAQ